MNIINLERASSEILQACDDPENRRLPYFFLIGAGLSSPPLKLAAEIEEDCKTVAQKYGRTDAPTNAQAIDTYSHWFDKAYPQPSQRQRYLRTLISGKPISQANFRLAHLLLQKKIASLVVTTNFDDYLSRALTLFGKQHVVCDHPSTVGRIDPEERDYIQIIHVHGSYWFYDCCNLRSEIVSRAHAPQSTISMPSLLENILWQRMPLVLGYSGWEGDIVMTALERRLKDPLPNRLYWFCYRRDGIEVLPDWLKNHENVYFVVPEKSAQDASAENPSGDAARIGLPPPSTDVKAKTGKTAEEPTLPSQLVLDKLIRTFALQTPQLTSDPLGFFAEYLRSSLPSEDAAPTAGDLYFIKSVVDRIERAKRREEADDRAARSADLKLEAIRESLRSSRYREAIIQARDLQLGNISFDQQRELGDAVWSATTLLADNSEEEILGYNLTLEICQSLLEELAKQPSAENDSVRALVHERAARALVDEGITFGLLGRREDELATYDLAIAQYGEVQEPPVAEAMADARINRAFTLRELKRTEDELSAYDDILTRYGDAQDSELQSVAITALFNKGLAFGDLSRFEEAITASDDLLNKFQGKTDAAEPFAQALYNKGVWLAKLNRYDDAIAAYDGVLNRFTDAQELSVREVVAMALGNKAVNLEDLNRLDEAFAVYDEVINRFGDSTESPLRGEVSRVLVNKGIRLIALDRLDDAIASFKDAVRRLSPDPDDQLKVYLRDANNGVGYGLLCRAKQTWKAADKASFEETLKEALASINASLEFDPDMPLILGNKGYVLFLLGDEMGARTVLERAIHLGGQKVKQDEISDSKKHEIPQDVEFRKLIESISLPQT